MKCIHHCQIREYLLEPGVDMFIKDGTVSWDMMPCGLVQVHRHFHGMHYLHILGQRVNQAANRMTLLVPAVSGV
jgi:hypothetical protein